MAHLQYEQRYAISVLQKSGKGVNEIARLLARSPSVISREIKRNSSPKTKLYNAKPAQLRSEERKKNRLYFRRLTPSVVSFIEEKLEEDYSPEQIVGYAKNKGIPCVSVPTIYKYIETDKLDPASQKRLYKHLRCHTRKYVKRGTPQTGQGQIPNRRMIDERPAEVDKKERFGDFEADTVRIANGASLVTLNDRASSFSMIRPVPSRKAEDVEKAIIEMLMPFKGLAETITVDNGKEFGCHKKLEEVLGVKVFFAHPYHSWERGANENTNKLYRQYFKNKTKLSEIPKGYIDLIQNRLNNRPRKRLGFESPNLFLYNKFAIAVAFTT